jgi:hypothetical protein
LKIKNASTSLLAYALFTSLLMKASNPSTIHFFNTISNDLLFKIITVTENNPENRYENGLINPFPAIPLLLTCQQYNDPKFRQSIIEKLQPTFKIGTLLSLLPSSMQETVYQRKIMPSQNYFNFLKNFCFNEVNQSDLELVKQFFPPDYFFDDKKNIIEIATNLKIGSIFSAGKNEQNLIIGYCDQPENLKQPDNHFKKTIVEHYLKTIEDHLNEIVYYPLNQLNENEEVIITAGRVVEAVLKIFENNYNHFKHFGAVRIFWATFGVVLNVLSAHPQVNLGLLTAKNQLSLAQELDANKHLLYFSDISKQRIQEALDQTKIDQKQNYPSENKLVLHSFIDALLYFSKK